MYCPKCGAKLGPQAKFCSSCGQTSKKHKKILLVIPLLFVLLIFGYQVFRYLKRITSLPKRQLLATYNKYPIWLLRDGQVAVYREMKVYTDSIEKQIMVKNLSGSSQTGIKIAETIPSEITSDLSQVIFSPQPEISSKTSSVEWTVDLYTKDKTVILSWKTRNLKYDVAKVLGVQAEETTFMKNFKRLWPTSTLKDPVQLWQETHDFSKKEMQTSARQATTGKLISVSKDVTDILATMATGTGILDTLSVMSELYSISTTLYRDEGAETQELVDNANWLLLAGSLIKSGWDNKELVKASYKTGLEVLRAGKSLKAAATANKLAEAANKIDPDTGVTAAEGVGLNIAGMIVDYAVINDVSKSSKYFLFEANEQAKMELASRYLVEWWQKYGSSNFTEGDAKKIMEMEILFFIAQQKELGVRKAYFKSQQGMIDTVQSWFPLIGQYSAATGFQDTEDNIITGQNQLRRRYSAREDIYKLTQGKEGGLKVLETAEKEALDKAKIIQTVREIISEVVEYGSNTYETMQKSFVKKTGTTSKDSKTIETKEKPSPSPINITKTLNFSLANFPTTLLGLPQIKTNTTLNPEDQCNSKMAPQGFIEVMYGSNEKIIDARVVKFESNSQAKAAPKILADCMASTFELTTAVEDKEPILGYPFLLVTAENQVGHVIDSSFIIFDKYLIGVSILTEERNGGSVSEHQEIMKILIPAFLTEGQKEQVSADREKPSEAPQISTGCQDVDLSNIEIYKIDSVSGVAQACPNWEIDTNKASFQAGCQMNAVYRIYGVKEISTGGKSELNLKANLILEEPAHLFPEGGVHYDNYVDLIVFDQKPSDLATCNQTVDSEGWKTKCAVANTSPGVLGHCGVPKNATSQGCDFKVSTAGKDKLYLVMATHDAWSYAKVIGGFSNIQVCR